jgi:ATP-dependent DNA helicase RecG
MVWALQQSFAKGCVSLVKYSLMKPSLQKLHKFFKLEAERGYDNHAVLGGLDRMLDIWEAEARLDGLPEDLIQTVDARIRDYARLSEKSRAETLEGLWRRIQRETASPAPQQPPAPETPPEIPKAVEPQSEAGGQVESREEGRPADETPVETSVEDVRPQAPLPETSAPPIMEPAALEASVTVLPGIGQHYAQTLERLELRTLRDMLYHFPRRYDDYSQLKPINRLWYGEEVTVIGTVQSMTKRSLRGGRAQVVEAVVSDGSGSLRVTWFNPWMAKRLINGTQIVLSGKVDQYLGRLVMTNPEWDRLEQQQLSTNRIVPVYPLTAQITQRWMRRTMDQVVSYWAPRVQDPLPEAVRRSAGLVDLSTALAQAHFPDSWEILRTARERLAFDEIFLLQLGVLRQKRHWQERTARIFETDDGWLAGQVERLPFALTGAQRKALEDVRGDLASGHPMNRLLQGDVGSGKTVIAALASAVVTAQAAQAAIMAPTSILAEQHYRSLVNLLAGDESAPLRPDEIQLLLGATPEAAKQEIRSRLAEGRIKVIVGTHALLEDPVAFANLQLTVVDEQHRFGVEQRAALRAKGENPHLLVMTATPIPRSLALTIYGDLDLTVMDEMPPGRQPVSTHVLTPRERERGYALIRSQIMEGRQAFIIYPLIEESEQSETMAAVEEQIRLQKEIFPEYQVGLLHGRMRPDDKEMVMTRFRNGEYHILVSTSVIEVGVDIPNATVMLIEGANRFGLAQLHQFRGRVGRGSDKSYCLLVPDTPDETENERLQVMAETNDGFLLAERDLEQRGPGQFLGTRQSGYAADLKMASLTDVRLIEKARRQAQMAFERDPDLTQPEHCLLASSLQRFWEGGRADIS